MSLIKIWKNKGKILEGIKNKIFTTDHIQEIADERMSICRKCPHYDMTGDKCAVPLTQPCCGKCGCSLGIKVYSLSSGCGDEENPRWDPILTEEEEDQLNDHLYEED